MGYSESNHLNYIMEAYEDVACMNERADYKTMLVRRRADGKVFIRKEVSKNQGSIYQQLKSFHHPNLASVHQVCFKADGCIVLEDYISGSTLTELQEEGKALPREKALNYFSQLLDGLEFIHKYHIIHRDLKPENIMISIDGVVKLLDFGIARFEKMNQSKDTEILGTVGYASPEQFGFQQTDVRTDIYAAGILLNKMLTGKMPNQFLVKDDKLSKIILKCIEIDPKNRYESVQALRGELKLALGISTEPKKDLCWIPGFRTGVTWKRVLAVMGYLFFILANLLYISGVSAGGWRAMYLEGVAMFLYIWLPFMITSNIGRWDRKMPGIRSRSLEARITIRILLSFLALYFGMLLENYVKYTMVGLPKTG